MTDIDDSPNDGPRLTRRASLLGFGGLIAGAAAGTWPSLAAASGGPAAVASGAVSCVLTPELTEGPYYLANEKVRRDITEGRPGAPLLLHLKVLDVSTCRAIRGAAVDIWHCDAGGLYSGFVAQSTGANGGSSAADDRTFMRGIQRTDANGLAVFRTVYPGWYRGRTVHIHVKVHAGGSVVHTGQLFFNDTLTDSVFKRAPYVSRGTRDTRNANDSIYVNGGSRSLLHVAKSGSGYTGSISMGVTRA
jgi:protocatechuate 3,4-dioxygenase beta subunit